MIIEHPTLKVGFNGHYHDPAHVVKCDFCRGLCKKTGVDPGDAADVARTVGWETRKPKNPLDGRRWICLGCIGTEFSGT
jgi:hypothetical protein